ncbi:MAG: DNA (cytosine-5-)-methyltransferase [Fimbriimonadaceae bacterium]|nr:DNA (cytosine-5-)-methyltransferase [Fimbriimonadaceae bacterium]QYK57871.1 MAG: DNA (cytosine-5-)-methyltransferase [Fimbriimonadaceae bacterium]
MTFVDLFCGIGGFHQAAASLGLRCVWACDIDPECRRVYAANYGIEPWADVTQVDADEVPQHDLLLAGFPCQPFSIIGGRLGFADTRGTLFFEIARIVEQRRPRAFVLENVKMLARHDQGRTLQTILDSLEGIGYCVSWKVLNALDFGLPQKRERTFIVGFDRPAAFAWPEGGIEPRPLKEVLEDQAPARYWASPTIRSARSLQQTKDSEPTIWHENKSGHVSKHPFACALRAGASHNYLLVDGERRLTEREMLRLQGFPDGFRITGSYSQARRQAGNAVPVPVARAVIAAALEAIQA